mmetsp:Transcript_99994/g.288695  ORF Transcript_99994/g.288695 Transcript_99994/m.288695 type:complete len:315 (-) Transcript_99994:705-1649(-)
MASSSRALCDSSRLFRATALTTFHTARESQPCGPPPESTLSAAARQVTKPRCKSMSTVISTRWLEQRQRSTAQRTSNFSKSYAGSSSGGLRMVNTLRYPSNNLLKCVGVFAPFWKSAVANSATTSNNSQGSCGADVFEAPSSAAFASTIASATPAPSVLPDASPPSALISSFGLTSAAPVPSTASPGAAPARRFFAAGSSPSSPPPFSKPSPSAAASAGTGAPPCSDSQSAMTLSSSASLILTRPNIFLNSGRCCTGKFVTSKGSGGTYTCTDSGSRCSRFWWKESRCKRSSMRRTRRSAWGLIESPVKRDHSV